MLKRRCFNLMIAFVGLVACSGKQPTQGETVIAHNDTINQQRPRDSFASGKIMEHIICKADATQSYALYIPAVSNIAPMPVIYCFDPHGNGALPLKNYQALADAYHFILIGSNNSKNGNNWDITQQTWNSLFNDTKSRLVFNSDRIYTCGFSGGAKVAGFIALHHGNIKGVICAGAGLPEDQPLGNFPFTFSGVAGRGDMNMTDLVALNEALDKTTTRHRLILFDGKHAWPPVAVMRTVFTGLQLDAMREKGMGKNDSLIQAFTTEMSQQVDKAVAAKKWIEAEQTCALAINMLQGLTAAAGDLAKKENSITANSQYLQQSQAAQQMLVKEQQQKQVFMQQFERGDLQYWTATISDIHAKSKLLTAEGAMYQRLLAYLSLAFYSISNNLINNNQNNAAQYFVTLYKMADGTNSEAWYFSALLNARGNHTAATEADLLRAAEYGFTDTNRILKQPEFGTLSPKLNFALIEHNMKKVN